MGGEGVIAMLMGVDETAAFLGLRPATVRRWVFERRLPSVKLGRRVLIRRDVLEDLIRRSERPVGPKGLRQNWGIPVARAREGLR